MDDESDVPLIMAAFRSVAASNPYRRKEGTMNDKDAFDTLVSILEDTLAVTRERADRRGPHGRRFALVATKVEEAWLQAKQGKDEAAG